MKYIIRRIRGAGWQASRGEALIYIFLDGYEVYDPRGQRLRWMRGALSPYQFRD